MYITYIYNLSGCALYLYKTLKAEISVLQKLFKWRFIYFFANQSRIFDLLPVHIIKQKATAVNTRLNEKKNYYERKA